MDKYEFNIKVEQIKKLVVKNDFDTAMKIADTIDWKRVRSANLLSMIAQVYEKNEEYQEAKEILLLAFERAPIGKRLLYKLAELALKEGSVAEAEDYYREFSDLAPDDPRQHLLRYLILKAKKAPAEQLLHSLERYTSTELDEKWMYELAELYRLAGKEEDCIRTCDRIMLMFGIGKYVDKAMDLKLQYAPLTDYQMDLVENRDKYEAKLRAVQKQFSGGLNQMDTEEYEEELPRQTLDEELEASIHQAEAEEQLAEELSKISIDEYQDSEDTMEKTKILEDLHGIGQAAMESAVSVEMREEAPDMIQNQSEYLQMNEESTGEAAIEEATIEEADEEQARAGMTEADETGEAAGMEAFREPELTVEDEEEYSRTIINHLMIEARTPEKGLELAVEVLKKIHQETGTKNPVAKISGSKLSQKGVFAAADKLAGKDLVIEEAGDLSEEAVEELCTLIEEDESGMIVVLIDNPRQMEELHQYNPEFASLFECIGVQESYEEEIRETDIEEAILKQTEAEEMIAKEITASEQVVAKRKEAVPQAIPVVSGKDKSVVVRPVQAAPVVPDPDEEMDLDEFAEYACKYASEIDCSIIGKSMLALYERIEIMEEDGIPLTKGAAEDLIEEAADKAEKPTLGKLITGVFSSKYDKEGLLILKEEHFI